MRQPLIWPCSSVQSRLRRFEERSRFRAFTPISLPKAFFDFSEPSGESSQDRIGITRIEEPPLVEPAPRGAPGSSRQGGLSSQVAKVHWRGFWHQTGLRHTENLPRGGSEPPLQPDRALRQVRRVLIRAGTRGAAHPF